VSQVLHPLRKQIAIEDVENYPKAILVHYPGCPRWAQQIFREASVCRPKFLKGWLRAHRTHNGVSTTYLDTLRNVLPPDIVAKFPVDDEREIAAESLELKAKYRRLTWASIWFSLIILVAALILWIQGFTMNWGS
jgi:hypothetical protein